MILEEPPGFIFLSHFFKFFASYSESTSRSPSVFLSFLDIYRGLTRIQAVDDTHCLTVNKHKLVSQWMKTHIYHNELTHVFFGTNKTLICFSSNKYTFFSLNKTYTFFSLWLPSFYWRLFTCQPSSTAILPTTKSVNITLALWADLRALRVRIVLLPSGAPQYQQLERRVRGGGECVKLEWAHYQPPSKTSLVKQL